MKPPPASNSVLDQQLRKLQLPFFKTVEHKR